MSASRYSLSLHPSATRKPFSGARFTFMKNCSRSECENKTCFFALLFFRFFYRFAIKKRARIVAAPVCHPAFRLFFQLYNIALQGNAGHEVSGMALEFGVASEALSLVIAFDVDNGIAAFSAGAFLKLLQR